VGPASLAKSSLFAMTPHTYDPFSSPAGNINNNSGLEDI